MEETNFDLVFEDVTAEARRSVFHQRYMQFLTTAYSWWIDAETLRRQKVARAQLKLHQRDIDTSLANCQKALDCARITQALMDEILPIEYSVDGEEEEITVDNMNEIVCVADMEKSVESNGVR